MIHLHAKIARQCDGEPFVVRVATNPLRPVALRNREAFLPAGGEVDLPPDFLAYLLPVGTRPVGDVRTVFDIPDSLNHLADGDIVRINPRGGEIWVMYRRDSRFNSMLLTERCNSNCVMCSQPPKERDDSFLVREYLQAIPLMDLSTPELGITGGEPTLLGDDLLKVITCCRKHLPNTALHMLSNGRRCADLTFCQELARVGHPDFMIGVPLYSDVAHRHDFIVQAAGAFDETVRGLMNLARCGVRLELRVVLHQYTVGRLPQLARFIARNLPFVEHVALMGIELMGYVRMNLDNLWIDPVEYQPALRRAVEELDTRGMNVSIYNHQLCVLDRELWPFARKSISDWKNEYLPECATCATRAHCGGFFSSSRIRHSSFIRPVGAVPAAP